MPAKKICNLKSNDNLSVVLSLQLTSRTLYIRHFKSNSNSWIRSTFCCRAFYETLLKSCILRTIYGCAFYKHEMFVNILPQFAAVCRSLQALSSRTLKKPKPQLHNRISQTLNRLLLRTLNLKVLRTLNRRILRTLSSRNLSTFKSRILRTFHGCSLRT